MTTDRPTEGPEAAYRLNDRGRPVKSVEHTLAAVTSIVGGLSRRRRRPDAGLMNDDLDLGELAQLVTLRETIEVQTAEAVADLYVKGYSWTDIGRALGVSRQAALKRYGAAAEALAPLAGADRQ